MIFTKAREATEQTVGLSSQENERKKEHVRPLLRLEVDSATCESKTRAVASVASA